tara:strand:+ start:496 stop:729 length:234 start_codon:yes stop_codon:yes gene_type:complete
MSSAKLKELKQNIKDAEAELDKLKENNAKLEDELESLWSMMDELKQADIKNWGHLVKQLKDDLVSKSLMTTNKKADC